MSAILALEFPPVSELIEWKGIFLKGTVFEVNKVVLLMWASVAIVFALFLVAGKRASRPEGLVPAGVQNVVEAGVDFVRKDIVLQTIGPEGLKFMPFLVTLFFFIMFGNLFSVIPVIQMPVNARIALPAFMAVIVWVLYNYLGIAKQGLFGYLGGILKPPGVPLGMLVLVAPIELVSTILVRPLSLAVRLFANALAGHILLATFAVLSTALLKSTIVGAAVPFALLVGLTGFELLVAVLQAFIFTILTAVYIGGALHPEH